MDIYNCRKTKKMTLKEVFDFAKEKGEEVDFEFTNPKCETVKCRTLDSWIGLFTIEGQEGFVTESQWKQATNDKFYLRIINQKKMIDIKNLKEGDFLQAIDPCEMEYLDIESLEVGKLYPIKYIDDDLIKIKSNMFDDHIFGMSELDIFFKIPTKNTEPDQSEFKNFDQLRNDVLVWANERNILKPDNKFKQALKMVSEVGELCDAIIKSEKPNIIDGIGDVLVTVIILAEQLKLDPTECLESAYNEIKNRTGKTENGVFVKD